MSDGRHFAPSAAGIAALPPDAPERAEAEEHARSCAECAAALTAGARLLALLDGAPASPPSEPALARARAAVLAEFDAAPAAPTPAGRTAAALFLATVAAWAAPLALARSRPPFGPRLATSVAAALVAAVAASAAITIGGLLAGLIPLASALFSMLAATGDGLHASVGVHCATIEVGVSLVPLAVAAFAFRAARVRTPILAVVAAAGALGGQAALHLTCPVASAGAHLFVFHTGGVALAAAVGVACARVLKLRAARG